MNPESAAADQVLRMELMVTESAVRLAAKGAVHVAALLVAILRNEKQIAGKTDIENIISSGTPTSFPLAAEKMKEFSDLAKQYGVMCAFVRDTNHPDTVDVIVREEDAKLVNKVRERIGATAEVSEKNAEAGLSESASKKSVNTAPHRPESTTTTRTTTKISQEQADSLLARLNEIRTALENGAGVDQCRAQLKAVQNELGNMLGLPERGKNAVQDKRADGLQSEERDRSKHEDGKPSVRDKIANIRDRMSHEPQHVKPQAGPKLGDRSYQPKHTL